jgi:hypothetical protein
LNQTNLKEIIADVYKKRAALSQELELMASSPKEKKTKRYNKLIDSYDKLTKRLVDLWNCEDGENVETQKMTTLFSLVAWAHQHQQEGDNKKQLMTIKGSPNQSKKLLGTHSPEIAERELEELLKRKARERGLFSVNSKKIAKHSQPRRSSSKRRTAR